MTFPDPWENALGLQQSIEICVPLFQLRPRKWSPGSEAWHSDRWTGQGRGGGREAMWNSPCSHQASYGGRRTSTRIYNLSFNSSCWRACRAPSPGWYSPQRGSLNFICGPPWMSQFSSVAQSCPTLWAPTDCNTPGSPVHHQPPELTVTHVHQVGDAIQPSHPLSSPSPPAFNLSQLQGLFQ